MKSLSSTPATARILVIEDEPQMLRNLLTILRAEDFRTLSAAGGEQGVAVARAERPDLILCDLMMPGLDGFGVLARLRAEPATAAIPFVFLTARGELTDIRAGMNQGADDYLTKPIKVDDLLAAIRARLDRGNRSAGRAGPGARRSWSGWGSRSGRRRCCSGSSKGRATRTSPSSSAWPRPR